MVGANIRRKAAAGPAGDKTTFQADIVFGHQRLSRYALYQLHDNISMQVPLPCAVNGSARLSSPQGCLNSRNLAYLLLTLRQTNGGLSTYHGESQPTYVVLLQICYIGIDT